MPNSMYVPANEPPSRVDRILKHGFLLFLGGASCVAGLLLALSIPTSVIASRALDGLHAAAILPLSVLMFYGFWQLVRGTIFHRCHWSEIDAVKPVTFGSFALSLAWLAFTLSVIFSGNPYASITLTLALGFTGGFGMNGVALAVSWARLERQKAIAKLGGGVE